MTGYHCPLSINPPQDRSAGTGQCREHALIRLYLAGSQRWPHARWAGIAFGSWMGSPFPSVPSQEPGLYDSGARSRLLGNKARIDSCNPGHSDFVTEDWRGRPGKPSFRVKGHRCPDRAAVQAGSKLSPVSFKDNVGMQIAVPVQVQPGLHQDGIIHEFVPEFLEQLLPDDGSEFLLDLRHRNTFLPPDPGLVPWIDIPP